MSKKKSTPSQKPSPNWPSKKEGKKSGTNRDNAQSKTKK